jgi:hypothetical protein
MSVPTGPGEGWNSTSLLVGVNQGLSEVSSLYDEGERALHGVQQTPCQLHYVSLHELLV